MQLFVIPPHFICYTLAKSLAHITDFLLLFFCTLYCVHIVRVHFKLFWVHERSVCRVVVSDWPFGQD